MSDYLNNLLARSFATPSHHGGLVVPRRWHEYEAQTLEFSQTESSQGNKLEGWSERTESPVPQKVVEQSPINFPVSALENHQTANKPVFSLPNIALSGVVTPPQQFEEKNKRNVLPLPTETKATSPIMRREIPVSVLATTPHLESREVLSPIVKREVLIVPPALPIPQMVKAKSLETQIPIKADPPLQNVRVNEKPTAVRTPPTNDESAIRPIIAPSIVMSAANQVKPAASVETVINVTIGRVEVRASQAPAAPVRKQSSAATTMSLDDYLQKRNGGRG